MDLLFWCFCIDLDVFGGKFSRFFNPINIYTFGFYIAKRAKTVYKFTTFNHI